MPNDYKEILTINYELSAMDNWLSIIFTTQWPLISTTQ
jgi:hypothetical protein